MVMVIMAIVVANTVYFMGVNKNTTGTNLKVATNIGEDNEKRRISAYLADQDVCGNSANPINFYNKDIVQLQSPTAGTTIFSTGLVRGSDTLHPFLKVNDLYIKNTHTLSKFYFLENTANPNAQTKYSLIVEYTLRGSGVVGPSANASIKKNIFVKIPLFVELAGGLITRCYARSDVDTPAAGQTNVEKSITNACTGTTAELVTSGSNVLGCNHNITTLACPTAAGNKTVLNAMIINASKQQTYTCGATTFSCASAPLQNFVKAVVGDGTLTCGAIEACNNGAMILRNGTGTSCTTNCAAGYLWSSVSVAGTPLCYERLQPCGAGTYTKEVRADGTLDCQPIVYKNVDCGAGRYATDMNSTAPSDPLTCGAYSKVKTCSSGTWFTSVTTTNPSCVTYTY